MLKKRKNHHKACVAIDIGSYSIKALEVHLGQDKYRIAKFALKELPQNPTDENISVILKQIATERNFDAKDTRISLSGPNVTVRFITMPEMSLQDLKSSLKFEADKYIPFSIDEVIIDSCILEGVQEEKGKMSVILAAAKKDIVKNRVELLRGLGFNVTLIDIDSFAAYNSFLFAMGEALDKEKSTAVINLGHKLTNIVITKGETPFFTRDIQMSNVDIGKDLLDSLTDEIRLSFGYYENQYGKGIDSIFISGGSSEREGLIKHFEDNLGIAPKPWDPIKAFEIDESLDRAALDKIKSSLAVCLGLSVR